MGQPARLEAHDLARLVPARKDLRLKARQQLFLSGELGGSVLLVESGRVKVSRLSAEGEEVTLSLLDPGDLLMGPEDPALRISETLLEAVEESLVAAVPRRAFEAFLLASPAAALTVVRLLAERIRAHEERIEGMVFQDIPGRLATTLLRLANSYGAQDPEGGLVVGVRMTQQELASLIGASREMVNHALVDWKRKGWIKLKGRSLVICEPEALTTVGAS